MIGVGIKRVAVGKATIHESELGTASPIVEDTTAHLS
jgi:hypothetical protein